MDESNVYLYLLIKSEIQHITSLSRDNHKRSLKAWSALLIVLLLLLVIQPGPTNKKAENKLILKS